jgi:hypothetical protein
MHRFADLRNDVAFRRVFAQHPEILGAMLDDLLARGVDGLLNRVELLSPEQVREVPGAALPLVGARCRAGRTTFLLEVQLLHVEGFLQRTMHEACRVYVEQPTPGGDYRELGGVVAVSICDYELWPDRAQDARRAPRVPMLSRWRLTEADSGADGAAAIEHVVLELPKLHGGPPEGGAERWAWLFRNAADLTEVPAHLPPGPCRRALELADLSGFTAAELEGYRRARDAVAQTRQVAVDAEARGRREGLLAGRHEGVVQGKRDGLMEGEAKGRREALRSVLLLWIAEHELVLPGADRARIESEARVDVLERWAARAMRAESVEQLLAEPVPASIMPPPIEPVG